MDIEILSFDSNQRVEQYFSKLLVNLGGNDLNIVEVDNFKENSYKIISLATLKDGSYKGLANFFVYFDSATLTEELRNYLLKMAKSTPGCLGVIDLSIDYVYYVPFFDSFMNQLNIIDSQKNILKKLNGTIQSILGQLQRVKGFHEKIVPIRNESFRGFTINSRFCAGTASGGEFFDFFKSGQSLWLFSINASSYITIGTFLSLVEQWKMQQTNLSFGLVKQNLNAAKTDFEGLGDISLLVLNIDLISLSISCLNIGGHEILNNEKVFVPRNSKSFPSAGIEVKETVFDINRGEQVVVLSPGFFRNTNDQLDQYSSFNFLKKNWQPPTELIQELTFQSKRKYADLDFMPYDQTIFVIGVEKNVIAKV